MSLRCLLCDGAVLFCQSRSSSEIHSRAVEQWVNLVLVTVRRVKDAGWCAELHAGVAVALDDKTPHEVDLAFGTWSPKRRTGNQTKARRLRPEKCRSKHGAEKNSTGPHAAELAFYFRGCRPPGLAACLYPPPRAP